MRFGNPSGMVGNSLANALRSRRMNPMGNRSAMRNPNMGGQMPAQMPSPQPMPMPDPAMAQDTMQPMDPIRQPMSTGPMPSELGAPDPGNSFGGPPVEMTAQRGGSPKSQKAPAMGKSADMMSSRLRRPGPISTDNSF